MVFGKRNKKNYDSSEMIGNFLLPDYQQINVARLQHLQSLGLNLRGKSVIEFGAGIGDHTLFYLINNSIVTPVEGRKQLVDYIHRRFNINVLLQDLECEFSSKLKSKCPYDIAHCYGILYHLSNPERFIKSVAEIANCILLETCVSPNINGINLKEEDRHNSTQALSGKGCRPDRKWIFDKLKENFKFVYMPITQPKHDQFPKSFKDVSQHESKNVRAVFIGSKSAIDSKILSENIVGEYCDW